MVIKKEKALKHAAGSMSRFRPLSDMLFSKPIKINCLFHSSEGGSYPCFSEDSDFVAVFVKTGVDVWHLKRPCA